MSEIGQIKSWKHCNKSTLKPKRRESGITIAIKGVVYTDIGDVHVDVWEGTVRRYGSMILNTGTHQYYTSDFPKTFSKAKLIRLARDFAAKVHRMREGGEG